MKLLSLLIFLLAFQATVFGQNLNMHAKGVSYEKEKCNFVIIDESNLGIFNTHHEIDEIRCVYFNGILNHILVKNGYNSDFYDLRYVADSLAFLSTFGSVKINLPIEKIDSLKSKSDLRACNPFEIMDVYIRHDSIIYDFSLRCLEVDIKKINANRQIGYPATFIGDLNLVRNKIEKECKHNTANSEQSIVFYAQINSKGIIHDLKLEIGSHSAFSESVRRNLFEGISGEFRRWKPAIVYSSGRQVTINMRLYAKLHKNGSVTILTTPRLFTFV